MRAIVHLSLCLLPTLACGGAAQPLSPPPPVAQSSDAGPPVRAEFVELSSGGGARRFRAPVCAVAIVTPVKGTAAVGGETLSEGDVLLVGGSPSLELAGNGEAACPEVKRAKAFVAQL